METGFITQSPFVTFPYTVGFNANSGTGTMDDQSFMYNVAQHLTALIDRAIIRFDEGQTLPKFQIHENSTKIYIPQDGKDYAIVNANEMGEMPVNSSLLTVLRSLRIAPYQWRGNEDPKGSHSILKALKFR